MEKIAHILFFSRPELNQDMSLRQLRQLCQRSGAQLTLLEVLEPVSQNLLMSEKVLASQLESKLIEHAETNLKLIAEDFIQAGVKTDTVVVKGKPVVEVLRQVNELSVDLLMLNAESESNLKQRIFGSTALHLIRKCPCPVWAIKSTCYYPMRNIMGAVDLNPDNDDRQRSNLNPDIARTTAMLADLLGTPAHLVQAGSWTMKLTFRRAEGWMTEPLNACTGICSDTMSREWQISAQMFYQSSKQRLNPM